MAYTKFVAELKELFLEKFKAYMEKFKAYICTTNFKISSAVCKLQTKSQSIR